MEKNWKNIGPVTVYCVDNIVGEYDDIRDFIRGNRWIASNKMTDVVRYSDFSDAILTRRAASLDKSYFYTGDRFHLRDESGFVVPLWVLDAKIAEVGPKTRRQNYVFRDGPVPGVRYHRWHRGSYYRNPATRQEIKENNFLKYDDDAIEYGVKARRSNYNDLPTSWDDIPKNRENNWKRFRKTQYKTVSYPS
jgi:hypothetical protein